MLNEPFTVSQAQQPYEDGVFALQDDRPDWRTKPEAFDAWMAREFAPRYVAGDKGGEPVYTGAYDFELEDVGESWIDPADVERADAFYAEQRPKGQFEPFWDGPPRPAPPVDPGVRHIRFETEALSAEAFESHVSPPHRWTAEEVEALPVETQSREEILLVAEDVFREDGLSEERIAAEIAEFEKRFVGDWNSPVAVDVRESSVTSSGLDSLAPQHTEEKVMIDWVEVVRVEDDGDYTVSVKMSDKTVVEKRIPEFALANRHLFEKHVGSEFPPNSTGEFRDDIFAQFIYVLGENGLRPMQGKSADELLAEELPPLKFIVDDLLPEGLSLLTGKPKVGKSWLALQIGRAVAGGTEILGRKTRRGKVLYLALEDSDRRMQSRLKSLGGLEGESARAFRYFTKWQPLEDGGLAALQAWIQSNHPTLVVIDVLQKLRTPGSRNENAYERDYRFMTRLQRLAQDTPGLSITVLHHEKKGAEEDFVEAVSGSFGLTGAADCTISLQRKRASEFGELRTTGRDAAEVEWLVAFNGGSWSFVGDIEDQKDGPREEAEKFLRTELANGPVETNVVNAHARNLGISIPGALKRAREALRVEAIWKRTEGTPNEGKWFMQLPGWTPPAQQPGAVIEGIKARARADGRLHEMPEF